MLIGFLNTVHWKEKCLEINECAWKVKVDSIHLHNFIASGSGEATGVSEELAENGVSGDEGGDGEAGDGDLGPSIHHLV